MSYEAGRLSRSVVDEGSVASTDMERREWSL